MRHITPAGLELIRHFEGFSAEVYLDAAGLPTIGYGHLIRPGENFTTISRQEALELLTKDVRTSEQAVLRLINVPLQDGQFDALVSFTFNCGAGALQRSTLRRRVNRAEHYDVPPEFLKWIWAGGRKLQGLLRRRRAEADLYAQV
jgi:lysozyme